MKLDNKVALVTGGGGGIGGAIAAELAQRGARIAVADLDLHRAESTVERIGKNRALALKLDVTRQEDFDTARLSIERELGPLDILINNAGVGHTQLLGEMSVDAFRWVQDVNLYASIRALQTFLPGMKARGTPGHIQFTCSITALRPFPAQAAYTTSKAALLNLALVLEMELADCLIGVSALCPGIVATDLSANARRTKPQGLRIAADDKAGTSPLENGMSPEAVGRVAVDAIQENRFYIFPHGADYRETIAAEQRFMLSEMGAPAQTGYTEPAIFTRPIRREDLS